MYPAAELHPVRVSAVLQHPGAEVRAATRLDIADLVPREPLMIASARQLLRRGLCNPIVHFAAIGATLIALRGAWQPAAEGVQPAVPRQPIVITAERIRLLQSDFQQRWGAPPTAAQRRALVDHAVEDE